MALITKIVNNIKYAGIGVKNSVKPKDLSCIFPVGSDLGRAAEAARKIKVTCPDGILTYDYYSDMVDRLFPKEKDKLRTWILSRRLEANSFGDSTGIEKIPNLQALMDYLSK